MIRPYLTRGERALMLEVSETLRCVYSTHEASPGYPHMVAVDAVFAAKLLDDLAADAVKGVPISTDDYPLLAKGQEFEEIAPADLVGKTAAAYPKGGKTIMRLVEEDGTLGHEFAVRDFEEANMIAKALAFCRDTLPCAS